MRRTELLLIVALVVAVVVAAIAGLQVAPDETLRDPRRSVALAGPAGASGLREALELLDVDVQEHRSALFEVADDISADSTWLVLLDLAFPPSRPELDQVVGHVGRGGWLFLAGESGVEHCFGYESVLLQPDQFRAEGVAVILPDGVEVLPAAHRAWRRTARDTTEASLELFGSQPECRAPPAADTVPLLRAETGRFVAMRLDYAGGGRVVLLADANFVGNDALRDTDAGIVVLDWLLADRPRLVVFDEYHQGFGEGGSLFAAAWRWLVAAPAGWTLLQVALAALVALWVLALRFGPAQRLVERRRRSPLEHVDALAVGLERADAHETAVGLLLDGLRRRLSRAGRAQARRPDRGRWLAALELAARTPEARARVRRLAKLLTQSGGHERVLETATAVEDVWNALGRVDGSSKRFATR